jgi:hypothetical protein
VNEISNTPTTVTIYLARAKHAEEKALRCPNQKGRDLWLHIALHYRTLAGFAERLRNDGF